MFTVVVAEAGRMFETTEPDEGIEPQWDAVETCALLMSRLGGRADVEAVALLAGSEVRRVGRTTGEAGFTRDFCFGFNLEGALVCAEEELAGRRGKTSLCVLHDALPTISTGVGAVPTYRYPPDKRCADGWLSRLMEIAMNGTRTVVVGGRSNPIGDVLRMSAKPLPPAVALVENPPVDVLLGLLWK